MNELVNDVKTTIVDVRSRAEYSGGHVVGSLNIPLQELADHTDELIQKGGAIVFCCASGGRSGMATQMFRERGYENAFNGGSWLEVNYIKNNG